MNLPRIENPIFVTELPSNGEKVKYRPFLVKEEKMLLIAAETKVATEIIENVNRVIQNCLIDSDINVSKLASYDAQWLFLRLRQVSISDSVSARVKCPITNKYFETDIKLTKTKIVKDEKRTNKIIFEKNIGVILRDLTLKDVFCDEVLDKMDSYTTVLNLIAKSVVQIFDENNVYDAKDLKMEDIVSFIESLRKEHFDKLANFFESIPTMRLEDEVFSPHANQNIKVVLDNFMDFFA